MNGYRALVEWQWQGKTEVLGEKPDQEPLWPSFVPRALGLNTGLRYERPKTKRWATTWPWQTVSRPIILAFNYNWMQELPNRQKGDVTPYTTTFVSKHGNEWTTITRPYASDAV